MHPQWMLFALWACANALCISSYEHVFCGEQISVLTRIFSLLLFGICQIHCISAQILPHLLASVLIYNLFSMLLIEKKKFVQTLQTLWYFFTWIILCHFIDFHHHDTQVLRSLFSNGKNQSIF